MAVFRPLLTPWESEVYVRVSEVFDVEFYVTYPEWGKHYQSFSVLMENSAVTSQPYNEWLRIVTDNMIIKRFFTSRFSYFDGGIFPRVFSEILKNNYDIVDTLETYTYSSLQAAVAKKLNQSKLVVTNFENIPWPWRRYVLARKIIMSAADAIVVHSRTAETKLIIEGYDPDRIHLIPCAVNTTKLQPKQTSYLKTKLGLSGPVVLYLGRISTEKGLPYLLYAFPSILKAIPNAKLVIIGQGPETQKLTALSRQLNIDQSVIMPGPIDHSKIQEAFALAEVFVLPSIPTASWREQFGYVLIEGMSCGKPVVASRTGAIPEIVDEGITGLLVKPKDVIELSQAILSLLLNPSKAKEMGANARKKAEEIY
ncbi:MAG: glycosyltransferase family 4 protein [Candidatus Bathyarchaeota archaeon]|nr:MAG: glycosyltransferase family 4 protein [Candidatus Bathyarchaeota archaeon]